MTNADFGTYAGLPPLPAGQAYQLLPDGNVSVVLINGNEYRNTPIDSANDVLPTLLLIGVTAGVGYVGYQVIKGGKR